MFNGSLVSRMPERGSFLTRVVLLGTMVVAIGSAAVGVRAQEHGRHFGAHGGPGMLFNGSPERVARVVDRWLDGLNATDAQRAQIKPIALAAAADLNVQRTTQRDLRAQGVQLFGAPSVDANAAESLRQQMVAQHDQASRRVLQAMLEVSGVLTPDQRVKVAERFQQRQTVMNDERSFTERRGYRDQPQR